MLIIEQVDGSFNLYFFTLTVGKFVFDMKTRVESENEKAFIELSESFMKFIQQLTRRQ